MRFISTDQAPAAIGPYSQATVHGGLLYASGQIALIPGSGEIEPGGVGPQARRALSNLGAVLAAAGSAPDQVLRCTVYLVDMADFAEVNAIYAEFFGGHRPARATVAVAGLPRGVRFEIDCVAVVP